MIPPTSRVRRKVPIAGAAGALQLLWDFVRVLKGKTTNNRTNRTLALEAMRVLDQDFCPPAVELAGLVLEADADLEPDDPAGDHEVTLTGAQWAAMKKAALEVAKASGVASEACRFCGCTEDRACAGGCAWSPTDPTVCTAPKCLAAAAEEAGKCGAVDGGPPCIHPAGHDGVHSNGRRTWTNRSRP